MIKVAGRYPVMLVAIKAKTPSGRLEILLEENHWGGREHSVTYK